jgi:VWFA-related protein
MSAAITAQGMTAIYDGILAGVGALEHASHTRQVLIAVSDGGDNASKATLEEAQRRIHSSDATVYAVALVDPLVRDGNPGLLRRLAKSTGGEFYSPRDVDDVPEAFERIARDIRSAYTLAYTPTKSGSAAERRRRTVRVYVRSQDGRALSVRTRDGYFEKTDEDQR